MGWLSVTSILLCDSEINEAGGERDVSRTRARKMGMAAWMDTIAGWDGWWSLTNAREWMKGQKQRETKHQSHEIRYVGWDESNE
jgi:hypothetical protein